MSKDFIWNTTAGVINASEAVIMSMVTTRYGTIEEAGILAIAFAIGNLLMTVGKAGARVFHSTDVKYTFRYKTYLRERYISVLAMALIMALYVIIQNTYGEWAVDKTVSVIIICIIYMIESMEDCIWGELQRNGYLYIGGMMFSARWSGILISFSLTMIIIRRLIVALGVSLIVSLSIFLIYVVLIRHTIYNPDASCIGENSGNSSSIYSLLKQTLPFFLSAFCVMYLNNSPKFSIDRLLSDEEQACFGFVAMPVFVIALANQFIYQPQLVLISEEWNSGKIVLFRRRNQRQILTLLGIGCACISGAAVIGIPVLSLIYVTDLSGYWRELVILQVAGLFLALSGYFTVILTTMREGKSLLIGYVVTMILSFLMMGMITKRYGTVGVSIGYMLLMIVLCLIYLALYALAIRRRTLKIEQMV